MQGRCFDDPLHGSAIWNRLNRIKMKGFQIPRNEDNDPHWSGWTKDLKLLPLEKMEKEGYTVEEVEDARGNYWKIIKITLKHE